MKIIAVEEHFTTSKQLDALKALLQLDKAQQEALGEGYVELEAAWARSQGPVIGELLDLGEGRLHDLDKDGIDAQVLSLRAPGVQIFDKDSAAALARDSNDELSAAVKANPKRLVGLAAIAPQDPTTAAAELERSVAKLGLRGANINSHTKGEYLDDRKFWPILEKAEKLEVPVYIHPRVPSAAMIKPYLGYPDLARAFFGYGAECGIHATRLICSGVFDEFPRLNIILGHLGEGLPFWMWRMDNVWSRLSWTGRMKKTPGEYLRSNFYISTSGNFSTPVLRCALDTFGAERIMFSVDYPIEDNREAVQFIKQTPISEKERELICYVNAERLFSL